MDRWGVANAILADQHGPWCAWCVDYISSPPELELHHILGYKDRVVARFHLEPWVVPVHRNRCHRLGLQDYADEAGRALLDAATLTPDRFEQLCKASFDRGYLPACVMLRRQAWVKAVKDGDLDVARANLLYALNASAGSGLGQKFLEEARIHGGLGLFQGDPDIDVYAASVDANAGHLARAWSTRDQVAATVPRVRPASSATYSKLARLTAILTTRIVDATEALSMARDSADPHYQRRTSKLALASAYEARRDYSAARAHAEELFLEFQDSQPSWWHSIEQLFLWARAAILSQRTISMRELRPPLNALIRAQYAAALLDFAGIPVPDFREATEHPPIVRLMPTDVVRWIGVKFNLSKKEMIEIRREAILDSPWMPRDGSGPTGFQASILNTLRFRDILHERVS